MTCDFRQVSVDQAGISSTLTTQSLEKGVQQSLKEQMAAKLEARRRKLEGHFPDEALEALGMLIAWTNFQPQLRHYVHHACGIETFM